MKSNPFLGITGPPEDAWNSSRFSPAERLDAITEILAKGTLRLMAADVADSDRAVIVDLPGNKSGHEPEVKP